MRTLTQAGESPGSVTETSDDLFVCRQIWEELCQVWVIIPFALRIRFQSAENRRNPDMFLDLTRTHAAINQFRREQYSTNGMPCVIVTIEDFEKAVDLLWCSMEQPVVRGQN
ncbi:MAG TPA: hypothetical protein VN429_08665 [Methanospirillum sp.]|uniref:hypothetical protein n=1 Tax=Methanospirillum sp. TaxID=45200 RepID=UPI002B6C70EB|nr:hypothetical protein [Methanospirillum sp.]HWQ64476.1 hypothetical protein [Methanospirillum sp.]